MSESHKEIEKKKIVAEKKDAYLQRSTFSYMG